MLVMVQLCTIWKEKKQMITERTLRRWRREALRFPHIGSINKEGINSDLLIRNELNERILRLTQELMDQWLVRKER